MITTTLLKAKARVVLIHFCVCLNVFAVIALWAYFVGYPSFYFSMAGAIYALMLIFVVDVVLGPLLSFLVYNPSKSKKETLSDFAIIALAQIAALCYGVHTLYQEHPTLLIVYPNNSATVLSHREVMEVDTLASLNTKAYSTLGGLPVVVFQGKSYNSLANSLPQLQSTDQTTRHFLPKDEQAILATIDSAHNKPYIISVIAKYNGAYIAIDKEFRFIAKFGEAPI